MSQLTYNDVGPVGQGIKQAVLVRYMPPWFADSVHGDFSNDRRLAKEEIDTIAAWVHGGAKEGDAKDAPAPLAIAEGWAMGKPDAAIEMAAAYDVPAAGTVEYTYFVVPTRFTEDKWVQSLEVRAGSRQVVHHIALSSRAPMARTCRGVRAKRPPKRCCCCLRRTTGPFRKH